MGFAIETEEIEEQETRNTSLPIQFNGNVEEFVRKAEIFAKQQIYTFFKGRQYHCGGPIPLSQLYSQQSVNTVLSYPFCEAIDLCHHLIGEDSPAGYEEEQVEWSTYCLLGLIQDTHRHRIEGCLRAGVILLYLKLCKGKRLPEIKMNVTHLLP